jgi:predicted metal-dependent hydrolase
MNEYAIIRQKRKTIAIHILPNGTVEVRAPKYVPNFAIKAFIGSKNEWIEKRLEIVKKNVTKDKKFVNGEKFMFLGKEYTLELGNYIHIEVKEDKLLFPLALSNQGRDILEKWYIKKAKSTIKNLVDECADQLGASYKSISFSDTKSKWGSCTHDNGLQFNWRLIMAPLLVVRYVVIHELVHTTNHDHQAIFWNKVRKINPSYKQQIKWLKANGDKLKI